MSDYIKYMYREYLEGRTRIKKVNEDQPLFPNTGAGLLIQKNKLTDDWTALNVSDGHYEEESFNHEALAAAFLQGANMGQLRMLNEILDRARLNGPYCLENVADALLSFAPACKAESLIEKTFLHFIELSKSFSKNGGIYDPVHGIYIESKVNGMGDVPHFTLYDVSVTVSLDAAGRYFATFLCTDVPTKDTPATDRKVGIDLGVETLATLSDGRKIGNPRHLKKYERKLARE